MPAACGVLPVCLQHGLASEETYPYTGLQQSCNRTAVLVPDSKPTQFYDVDINSDAALTEAVAKQPVSIAIEADEPVFQFYSSGVLTGNCGTNLDHGVLAVSRGGGGGGGPSCQRHHTHHHPTLGPRGPC